MKDLDHQYKNLLDRWGKVPIRDPFEEAAARAALKPEMEKLAAAYLAAAEATGSQLPILRLLALFELFRSTEVSLQSFRMAAIGKRLRAKWPPHSSDATPTSINSQSGPNSGRPAPRRTFLRSERTDKARTLQIPHPEMEEIKLWNSTSYPQRPLSYENVLLLHCGLVGSDLVIVPDANFSLYAYGEKALASGAIQSAWFSDYSYDPVAMHIEGGLYPPIVRKSARRPIHDCAARLHAAFNDECDPQRLRLVFSQAMEQLDELFDFPTLESHIASFARDRRINAGDVCVVWLPFEFLFRVSLSFLGHSHRRPLVQNVGGVSCALGLVALKYSVMKNHWMSGRDRDRKDPRCVLMAADPTGELNLAEEVRQVARHFPAKNMAVFQSASALDFALFGNAGEILWFCGHGAAARQHVTPDHQFQFLHSGPQFIDRVVSNFEIISVEQHNFESVWLMVMNCCVLGESEMIGSNPIGFMTATYAAGAIACISSLWAVGDDAAVHVADRLAAEIPANYSRTDFPRARALQVALRNCIEENPAETWRFASYALWGLP